MSRVQSKKSTGSLPPNWRKTVGDRLREERQRLGLTQLELAQRIGAVERTVTGYEAGTSTIRFEKLMALAAIGIEITYLVYGPRRTPSEPVNEALWERVKVWADRVCIDSRGKPMHEMERYQVMQRAYWRVAGAKTKTEIESAMAQLETGRVARR